MMHRPSGLLLNIFMLFLLLFTAAIGTLVMQVEYRIPPTPWLVIASCVLGAIAVLLVILFMWFEYKDGR